MEKLDIGSTASYIQDYKFSFLVELPAEAAVAWVQSVCPEATLGSRLPAKQLTLDGADNDSNARCNGWLNKLFVIVGESHGRLLAIDKYDGGFSLYIEREK